MKNKECKFMSNSSHTMRYSLFQIVPEKNLQNTLQILYSSLLRRTGVKQYFRFSYYKYILGSFLTYWRDSTVTKSTIKDKLNDEMNDFQILLSYFIPIFHVWDFRDRSDSLAWPIIRALLQNKKWYNRRISAYHFFVHCLSILLSC